MVRHRGRRRRAGATLLPGGRHADRRAGCPTRRSGPVGRYLYEPDGAVIRAHLVAEVAEQVGGGLIDPTIAYVTADELRADAVRARRTRSPTCCRSALKKLKALLREREVGIARRSRSAARRSSPEELRRELKPEGPNAATVFLTRVGGRPDDAARRRPAGRGRLAGGWT